MSQNNQNKIFVFGSNLSGYHGAGAAKAALKHHGAVWGEGVGLHGNSYAIPSKGMNIVFMKLIELKPHIDVFIKFAKDHPEMTFQVTQIGCGLAGFTKEEVAPLFKNSPNNCEFDSAWESILGDKFTYWGTY